MISFIVGFGLSLATPQFGALAPIGEWRVGDKLELEIIASITEDGLYMGTVTYEVRERSSREVTVVQTQHQASHANPMVSIITYDVLTGEVVHYEEDGEVKTPPPPLEVIRTWKRPSLCQQASSTVKFLLSGMNPVEDSVFGEISSYP